MSDGDGSPSGGGGPAPAGGAPAAGLGGSSSAPPASDPGAHKPKRIDTNGSPTIEDIASLTSPRLFTPNPFSRKNTSLDIDDYFTGPRDIQKHSKWPIFLQMHGSILPKMILPLLAIGGWATALTCVSRLVTPIGINSILLTVLGFVVGLSLSFRSSTAYERYNDGRKYWSQLILATQNLGRVYWIHSTGRKEVPEEQKELIRRREVLERLTAMNLIVAFAVAVKHKLRFEPYTCYEDISSLIAHLDTFAKRATEADPETAHGLHQRRSFFKSVGEYLGVSFAESNPRKKLKKATSPVGNLPLEILSYLASYTDELALSGRLPVTMHQTMAYNNLLSMNDVLIGTERVLNTPLPIAYSIAIAQITWVYILLLPFQLLSALQWLTIPATVAAAYIILGLLFIGREIENPFGQDVNDLPLEAFCAQIAADMDVLASRPPRPSTEWMDSINNHVLWPLSNSGFPVWMSRPEDKIHEAVNHKVEAAFQSKRAKDAAAEAQAHRRHLHTSEKNGNNKDSVEAV